MGRRSPRSRDDFVLFNVTYADGSQTSNRKVATELLDTYEGDKPARDVIEAQDREIAERSGRPRAEIKSIVRAGK